MDKLLLTGALFLTLVASAGVGFATQRRLHPRHISRDAFESVRLLMAMLVTFTALVLGLLTSSAKERYDAYLNQLSAYAADLIELDHRLRVYGEDAEPIRLELRKYTAAAIADTWPNEKPPSGDYPRLSHPDGVRSIEAPDLGDMLSDIDERIQHLAPTDTFHAQIAERLRNRVADILQRRWQLILSARSTLSWPFLVILTIWLAVIFGTFALSATRDTLVYAVVIASALSIASPMYLILEYSGAQSGLLELPSVSMRSALAHMDRSH